MKAWILGLLIMMPTLSYGADIGIPLVTVSQNSTGQDTYSLSMQIFFAMTALSFLPALLMLMTSFTRIIIVLAILRQALGIAQTPTNQILIGISLFLTLFIMMPVFQKINVSAIQPYMDHKITQQQAIDLSLIPIRDFMLKQTRKDDLALFAKLSNQTAVHDVKALPFVVIMPAFLTSELKTAFQMGFMLFIPFLIVDLVVASVLMGMGMMMLSPLVVSLPFKIMLFVLVDGWTLIIGSLSSSFG